jgi:hypothetical protein
MSHFWCEQLGYVSHAPLGLSFNGSLWFCRQLQNGCLLAFTQACQQHDPAIRKFQRIVMRCDLVFIDLPKDRSLMLDYFIAPRYQARRELMNKVCHLAVGPLQRGRITRSRN